MTNHEYKFIFIHYPKTGGSSVESFFGEHDLPDKSWNTFDNNGNLVQELHHTSSSEYIHKNGNSIWDNYFKFSICRNPWDVFVSDYLFDVRVYHERVKDGLPQKYRRKFIVEDCDSDFNTYILEGSKNVDWFKFLIQKEFTYGVDWYLRFENFQSDFSKLCEHLHIDSPHTLPHEKKSENRLHYSHYYTEETKDIIGNLFDIDINYFGYEFEEG